MRESDDLSRISLQLDVVPAPSAKAVDPIEIWYDVVLLVEEARTGIVSDLNSTMMLNRPTTNNTLFGTIMPTEMRTAPVAPATDPLTQLRGRLIIKLEGVKTRLYDGLPDVEASALYAALVFFVDEMVLREPGGRNWQLLQQEMFDITDGGERFFELVDQRLAVAQTSPMAFEIFYYLLSDQGKHKGFLGRYSGHVESIAQYRRRLQERIQAPEPAQRKQTQRRSNKKDRLANPYLEKPLRPWTYYAMVISGVFFIGLLVMWLSDLPDLAASRSRVTASDAQMEAPE